jgi:hypothetical protein
MTSTLPTHAGPRGIADARSEPAHVPAAPGQPSTGYSGTAAHGRGAACYHAGMSTTKRAVAARMAERRAARADRWRGRHHPEGPKGEPPVIRPATGELLQIVRWVRRHYWAVQTVLVVMALTLAALGLTGLLGFWSP